MTSRAFAGRSLLCMALAWLLLCGVSACGEGPPPMLSIPVPQAQVHEAYLTVQALMAGQVNLPWPSAPPLPVLRIFEDRSEGAQRLVGMYFYSTEVDKKGRMKHSEKIEVYLRENEECYLQQVLVHELLHAVHQRLIFLRNPKALAFDPEAFVLYFQGPPDWRACKDR